MLHGYSNTHHKASGKYKRLGPPQFCMHNTDVWIGAQAEDNCHSVSAQVTWYRQAIPYMQAGIMPLLGSGSLLLRPPSSPMKTGLESIIIYSASVPCRVVWKVACGDVICKRTPSTSAPLSLHIWKRCHKCSLSMKKLLTVTEAVASTSWAANTWIWTHFENATN